MMKLWPHGPVHGRTIPPLPPIRAWRLSALWSLSAVLLVAPARGAAPAPPIHPSKRDTAGVARPAAPKRRKGSGASRGDEYAHVYYEFSARRGFHVYVRDVSGVQREITDEPGWEGRHIKALEAHHRARRERYIRRHPGMDAAMRKAIEAGRLLHGMTTEQARACAGRPVEEKRMLTREGLIEDWRYGMELLDGTGELPHFDVAQSCAGPSVRGHVGSCVLHFIDGVLVDWESPGTGTAAARRDVRP